jgi:hypothetical protein
VFPAKNWGIDQVLHFRPRLEYSMGSADVLITDLIAERIPQYLGRADKFFFQHLTPEPVKLDPSAPKRARKPAPASSNDENKTAPE